MSQPNKVLNTLGIYRARYLMIHLGIAWVRLPYVSILVCANQMTLTLDWNSSGQRTTHRRPGQTNDPCGRVPASVVFTVHI